MQINQRGNQITELRLFIDYNKDSDHINIIYDVDDEEIIMILSYRHYPGDYYAIIGYGY